MTVDKTDLKTVLDYYFKYHFKYLYLINDATGILQHKHFPNGLNWRVIVLEAFDAVYHFNDKTLNRAGYVKSIMPTFEFVAVLAEKIGERIPIELKKRGFENVIVPFTMPSHKEVLTYVKTTWDKFTEFIIPPTVEENAPIRLHAHKTTCKSGFRQLENSVRKMW